MHDPALMDPDGSRLRTRALAADELVEVVEVMRAMRAWKIEEARQSRVSSEFMRLGERDMQALRFILAGERAHEPVTAVMVAEYLGITSAATTKLLDRLEQAGHVERARHPDDRRAIVLRVTETTRDDAWRTVGVAHARRFAAAARLSSAERRAVIRFLEDLAATTAGAELGVGGHEPGHAHDNGGGVGGRGATPTEGDDRDPRDAGERHPA